MSKFHDMLEAIKHPVESVGEAVGGPFRALEKEAKLGPVLHSEVMAALKLLQDKHPDIRDMLKNATGFAVVPSIGRASLVLGGAYGLGEIFEHQRVIGYAAIIELTLGIQIGGTTFHELVVFHDEGSLERFKAGKFAFAADAGVAIVKAGAQASRGFGASSSICVFDEGGMLLDLAIGGQKFIFRPAGLGRLRTAEGAIEGSARKQRGEEQGDGEPWAKESEERPAERH